jgi:hypothetical protein
MCIVIIYRASSPFGRRLSTVRRPRERYVHIHPTEIHRTEHVQLLLRIEKYPHRMNFNKGILESRRLHYKHLAKLLVSIVF